MDAAVVPPHLYAVYPSSAFPRVLSPSSLPLSSEDFRRLSPSHASCRRLRRVPVCGPVHRAYCCGNCFHIKHKKCKILCYQVTRNLEAIEHAADRLCESIRERVTGTENTIQ